MANDGPKHNLVPILAADIVGYSRMMEADQAGTLHQLGAARKEVMDPAIAEHGGRTFKTMGDGFLVEFGSAQAAVECAVAIQQTMASRNAAVPDQSRIVFRIGVNLGDVVIEGDDLFGNGVNIAARLESIADPGGVCISGKVHSEVRGEAGLTFQDRGPQSVKNISEPVQAYAVDLGEPVRSSVAPKAKTTRMIPGMAIAAVVLVAVISSLAWQSTRPPTVEAAVVADMAFALPDKPSIAVLAFDNLSTADDELLADSFSEDILTSLSKLSGLFVISRTTSFTYKGKDASAKQIAEDLGIRYLLEGSIQRDGDRIRVNAQLIDAIGGQHVWADRYDRDVDDLFAVKDEITLNIISNIDAELLTGNRGRVASRETESLEAWLIYKQGLADFQKFTLAGNTSARSLSEQALSIDPNFVSAIALLGMTYDIDGRLGVTPEVSFEKALELFEIALELAPGHAATAVGLTFLYRDTGDLDLALDFAKKAVALDPNNSASYATLGEMLRNAGFPEEALSNFRLALRLSPVSPAWVHHSKLISQNILGQYAQVIEDANRNIDQLVLTPGQEAAQRRRLAVALAMLGREDEALAQMSIALELRPWTIARERNGLLFLADQVFVEDQINVYRRLGVPEE